MLGFVDRRPSRRIRCSRRLGRLPVRAAEREEDQMESARLQIARVFGIPVYIHASWLIIFGLITWTLAIGYFPAR